MIPRQLPTASDRERMAAAQLAAERLTDRLRKRNRTWAHFTDSAGKVISQDPTAS
jgi:hypothetical protein